MSSIDVFKAEYTIPVAGISFVDRSVEWTGADGVRLWLHQEDGDATLRLEVVVPNTTEADGAARAERIATNVLEVLTVDHGDVVIHAGPLQLSGRVFGPGAILGAARLAASAVVATYADRARVEAILQAALNYNRSPAAGSVRLMYRLALESPQPVIRYLAVYSVLMLLAEVTGQAKDPNHVVQSDVDAILLAEDRGIPTSPDPRRPSRSETQFTRARNDFIHAEDRGRDPRQAAREMGALVYRFTNLAGRIVAKVP